MPFSAKWGDIDEDADLEDLACFTDPDANNQTPTIGCKFLFPCQVTIEPPHSRASNYQYKRVTHPTGPDTCPGVTSSSTTGYPGVPQSRAITYQYQ